MEEELPRIEGYEVLDRIGVGSFAEVYSAKTLDHTNRLVAIKILREDFSRKPFYVNRFETESQALSMVNSQGSFQSIISLVRVTRSEDQRPCIVMAYAANGSLFDRLAARRASNPFNLSQHLAVATKVVDTLEEGLKAIHQRGFVHRDIKPENLLIFDRGNSVSEVSVLSESEYLSITDFGLTSSYQTLTLSSELTAGSGPYIAPEALESSHLISPVDDLYSATVTILFVLTGQPLDDGWVERARGLQIPEQLITEIQKGTDKNRANRHSSVVDWVDGFRSALARNASLPVADQSSASAGVGSLVTDSRVRGLSFAALTGLAVVGGFYGAANLSDDSKTANDQSSSSDTTISEGSETEESISGPEANGPVEPFDGPTESCTVYFDRIPEDPFGFADVGEGGFVPGEGDCERLNMVSLPGKLPIAENWGNVNISGCVFKPVNPEIHPTGETGPVGDYRAFVKTAGQDKEIMIDHGNYQPGPGFVIEYIRLELSEDLLKPAVNGNDYLGGCSLALPDRQEGFATELNFNLDDTGITQDSPNRF